VAQHNQKSLINILFIQMPYFRFNTAGTIVSGAGVLSQLPELCSELCLKRPIVISDPGVVAAGLLDLLSGSLAQHDISWTCFSDVEPDPPESVIYAALEQAVNFGADGVIGFGGGSSLDTAKLVALMAKSGEKLADIYGIEIVKGSRLPLIQVPTTAGTGSEVTPIAIVTNRGGKSGVISQQLLPDVALLDAELTLKLPPAVSAATGVDAMVHAIEAYTSIHKKNPYSDLLAKEALQLLGLNIRPAVNQGDNINARQAMLLGACLAGQAFANAPVAAVHALAYPLGTRHHIPHGLSNALVLPHVLEFNAPQASKLYAELAPFIIPDISMAGDDRQITERLIAAIKSLLCDLNLPSRLSDLGVPQQDLKILADEAMMQQRLLTNNPRTVTYEDALTIYQSAF
jgi:alcohol dehydrogenase